MQPGGFQTLNFKLPQQQISDKLQTSNFKLQNLLFVVWCLMFASGGGV